MKSAQERCTCAHGVKVYAGVERDSRGRNIPTAVGKLCRWIENGNQQADFFTSYAAYQRSLFLNCDKGHSGMYKE
ncbi:Protein Skeletor, isoforms D/E [Orchesella cincta]|uniref:Protein Skeletor, isoforms D/E n=1 Tax=Orchesella cincta TaxID=48709 RepID=A0A1D2NGA9_ORCCI|nr:Protein Skeletor, isoforms D/E [Orchesella cincta]